MTNYHSIPTKDPRPTTPPDGPEPDCYDCDDSGQAPVPGEDYVDYCDCQKGHELAADEGFEWDGKAWVEIKPTSPFEGMSESFKQLYDPNAEPDPRER